MNYRSLDITWTLKSLKFLHLGDLLPFPLVVPLKTRITSFRTASKLEPV